MRTKRMKGQFTGSRNDAGFTLIEIVIALLILAFSMTAIFASFNFQQKSYLAQNAVAEMQQNVRGAMNYMELDLRNAGGGIPPVVAYHIPALFFGGTTVSMVSGVGFADGGAGGSDNVYMISVKGIPAYISADMPNTSAELKLDDVSGWVQGDIAIIFDDTDVDVFQVTAVQSSSQMLQHNPQGVFGKDLSKAYGEGSKVAKLQYAGYFLDFSDPAHPTLMKNFLDNTGTNVPQVVADDIEDMQVRLVMEDGSEHDGDWFPLQPDPVAEMAKVRKVRLYLMGRTQNAEKGWNEGPRAKWNHTTLTALSSYDNYRRRDLEMLVDLRNAGLAP